MEPHHDWDVNPGGYEPGALSLYSTQRYYPPLFVRARIAQLVKSRICKL